MGSSRSQAVVCAALYMLLSFLYSTLGTEFSPVPVSRNNTLVFDSVAHGNSLRNCSCASAVRDCDEALANLLCSCRTVPRSSLPPGGLRVNSGAGDLTVWVRDPWVLRELLNGSEVPELHLSLCAATPLDGPDRYLALFGLRKLRVHTSARGAQHPEQALNISFGPGNMEEEGEGVFSGGGPTLHVSFLDVSVLNGASTLKAYSVSGPPVPSLTRHFPNLALPPTHTHTHNNDDNNDNDNGDNNPTDLQKPSLLTFIY
ncbi:uncharacterized protein C21orf62 homolog [Chanos chanos]|uniref:Uncharacterized protein C21orf62 homolog n=1 Tax=Chanos chanos TaxID=29144 RepID=A0A6J2WFB8_CHACN|nr:uncharacterized protein C21orf62 homolog [Chanos chanos]